MAFILFAGCISAESPEPHGITGNLSNPWQETATVYLHTYDRMQDIFATVTITSSGGSSCEKIWFEKPDNYRIENTCPRGTGYNLTVFDGTVLWRVKNATQEVYLLPVGSLNFTFPDESDTTGIDSLATVRTILGDYKNRSVIVLPTQQENVSEIRITNITPPVHLGGNRFGDIYSANLVIGQPSGILKRAEFFDQNNHGILSIEYSDVRINSGLSGSIFSYVPPQNSTIKPVPTLVMTPVFIETSDEAVEYSRKGYFGEVHLPGYIPSGYRFSQGMSVPGSWISFVYSDAGKTLRIDEREGIRTGDNSLFWYTYDIPDTGNATLMDMNGTSGTFSGTGSGNYLQWIKGNISYLVSGQPDKDELIKIAESIQ